MSEAPDLPGQLAAAYQAHFDYVWRSLRRLGVASRDLEDVAHDVFLIVHRRLPDYDPARPMRPWLFGIAYRVASDYRGSARVRRERLDTSPPELEASATPDHVLATRDRAALIQLGLESLDVKHRAVFVMHDLEGHTMAEVAEALGESANTLYSRLRKARERFAASVRRAERRRKEA